MNVSGVIQTILAANNGANTLLGNRVYPVIAPQQSTYPLAVVGVVSVSPANTKSGPSLVDNIMFQVDVYASTLKSALDTDEAIRVALDYYPTTSVTVTGGGTVPVDSIHYASSVDGFENDPELVRRTSEYVIRIKRS